VAAGASHIVRAHLIAMQQGLWHISPSQVGVTDCAVHVCVCTFLRGGGGGGAWHIFQLSAVFVCM